MSSQTPVSVHGIWLRREGDHAVVLVERKGEWTEVIREFIDGPFSHIVEPGGVRARCDGDQPLGVQVDG